MQEIMRELLAIEQYKLAIKYNPTSNAYNSLGNAFYQLKRYEEAIEAYKLAIQYNPSSNAYNNLGNALYQLKRFEEAIVQFKLADPYFSNTHNTMGNALQELKRYEEAIEEYKLAIQFHPSDISAYNYMGNAFYQLKRYEESIVQYKIAVQFDPSYSSAYNNMGNALVDLKRYEEAIVQYKLAVQFDPSYSSAYYNMGNVIYQLKRFEEAIEQYKRAIQFDISFSQAYHNMGYAFVELKRYEEAIEVFKLTIQYNPSNPRVSHDKGRALMIMGRYDEALEDYKHSIEQLLQSSLFDNELYELNNVNIGWIMIKRRDFQSADQIFKFELKNKLSTDVGKLIITILLYKQGDFHSSLSLFHNINITKLIGLLEIYYYYMAMCLWKSMKNEGEDTEEQRRIKIIMIIDWLIKSIENNKEWVKPYYRRAQLLPLLQSTSDELISSPKADFQFVIQSNQQNAPYYRLSLSKITFLLSLQNNEEKKREEKEIQRENIVQIHSDGIKNEYKGVKPSQEEQEIQIENIIHIDSDGITNLEYKGVIALIKGYSPPHSCVDHILSDLPGVLIEIRAHIPYIVNESIMIAQDRLQRIKEGGIILSEDEAIAIASYSYDLRHHSVDASNNLYQILNNVLRERNPDKMKKLQAYLCYLMTALSKLNAVTRTVYRGISSSQKQFIEDNYLLGSKIHWSAFTSTTTSLEKAKRFTEEDGGIIFRIKCQTGRSIRSYSSFPQEDEVLLSPNCSLTVTKELHLKDGYYQLNFVENRNNLFLF